MESGISVNKRGRNSTATALVMMWFLFMVMQQIIGNTVSQIKLLESFAKSLTTRVRTLNNDLIKLDTSVSAALGLKNLTLIGSLALRIL